MIYSHLQQYIEVDDKIKMFFNRECDKIIYDRREIFSQEGCRNRKIYFIEKGLVRGFYYDDKGKEITSSFYLSGSMIACIDTLFRGVPTKYNFETLEKTILFFCDYQKIEDLFMESVEYARFARFVTGNLMLQMADRIASLQYLSAKEKYEKLMNEMPSIFQRVPLGMLASYLGITQETLSRIRNNV